MPAGTPTVEADVKGAGNCKLIVGAAVLCAAATVFFGVIPSPLVDWASAAGSSLAAAF
jgi:hypothetical protein